MVERTFVDIFSGAGGLGLGVANAGVRPVLAVDRNKDCMVSYAGGAMQAGHTTADHPLSMIIDRVERVDWSAVSRRMDPLAHQVDLLVGGPPCQPFSVLGLQHGADDSRNGLPAYLDALSVLQPKAFILENVAQLWSRNDGPLSVARDFIDRAVDMGYTVAYGLLDAADFGVPQHRVRFFAVGFLGVPPYGSDQWVATGRGFALPHGTHGDPLLIGPGGSLKPWVTVGEALRLEHGAPLDNPSRVVYAKNPVWRPKLMNSLLVNGKGRVLDLAAPAPTITAESSGNGGHILDLGHALRRYHEVLTACVEAGAVPSPRTGEVPDTRRLTTREAARLQGFPDGYPFAGTPSSVFRQIGNAVPPPLAEAVARAALAYLDRLESIR